MVEATGLEPAASCSQSRHSTKLSYASMNTETGDSQTALTVIKYTLQGGDLSSVFCKKKKIFCGCFRHGKYALMERGCETKGQGHPEKARMNEMQPSLAQEKRIKM